MQRRVRLHASALHVTVKDQARLWQSVHGPFMVLVHCQSSRYQQKLVLESAHSKTMGCFVMLELQAGDS